MNFTFGLLSYNQASIVVETLESIKYQITNYGSGINVDLIVVDDCSEDESVDVIETWISENRSLFSRVLFSKNDINKGIVSGFQFIQDNCDTEFCKVIAGDDVFSSSNLFLEYAAIEANQIVTFNRVDLLDGKLVIKDNLLALYCLNSRSKRKQYLKRMRRGCFFHTPSTIFDNHLYKSAKCSELNSKYRNLEDDPTWYAMIKNTDDISVLFKVGIIVLYRVSPNSISNSVTNVELIRPDFLTLWNEYLLDTVGLENLYFRSKLKRKTAKCLLFYKYVDKLRNMQLSLIKRFSSEYRSVYSYLESRIQDETIYYEMIRNRATSFYRERLSKS